MRAASTAIPNDREVAPKIAPSVRRSRAFVASLSALLTAAALGGCGRSALRDALGDEGARASSNRPAPRNRPSSSDGADRIDAGPVSPAADGGRPDAATPRVDPTSPERPRGRTDRGGTNNPPAASEPPPAAADAGAAVAELPCQADMAAGQIMIQTEADIARLADCRVIRGDLLVMTGKLSSLRGLEALTHVEGRLHITPVLVDGDASGMPTGDQIPFESLAGLENLQRVRALEITDVDIRDLTPLANLKQADSILLIQLDQLTDLRGLEQVQWQSLALIDDDALTTLNGLTVPAVAQEIVLADDPKLADLSALRPLGEASTIAFLRLPSVASLEALGGLRSVSDLLTFVDCDALVDLTGLGAPLRLVSLMLDGNDALRTLTGLTLSEPLSLAQLTNHPQLASLSGLMAPGDNAIQQLVLADLPALPSLTGLEALRDAVEIRIDRCNGIANLSGLNTLQRASLLHVTECAALQTLEGMPALAELGALEIIGDATLASLHGLEAIQQLDSARINDNPSLATVTGLDAVATITTLTQLQGNGLLASLRGLGALTRTARLQVSGNPSLPQCELDWLYSRVGQAPTTGENGPPGMCAP